MESEDLGMEMGDVEEAMSIDSREDTVLKIFGVKMGMRLEQG